MITKPHARPFTYPIIQEYASLGLDPAKIELLCLFDLAGNLYDASGNQRHGDISLSSGFSGTGRYGTGMYFDGVDDYVTIPDFDDSGANLTVSAWFRKTVSGGSAFIVHTDNASNRIAWTLAFDGANKIEVALSDVGTSNQKIYTTGTAVTINGWTNFIFTWGNSTLKLYLNGKESTPNIVGDDPMTNIFDCDRDIHIGTNWSGDAPSGGKYTGDMDLLMITKETLNATQIQNLYNKGL